ncbi:hypothetical protein AYI68_g1889 [Smittium mucronatum]|uniref:Uncharacterized protein n=1 Tax=Smittium mucronatum TaxID=133383 RepID=A0A1R0H457_9FUNG|nr:hypothetical protein AYI68_g1889 [Smittium mucronatum]
MKDQHLKDSLAKNSALIDEELEQPQIFASTSDTVKDSPSQVPTLVDCKVKARIPFHGGEFYLHLWSKKGDRPESGATPKQRHSMRLGQDTGPDQTSSTLIHPAWSFQWGGEVGGKIGEIGDAWGNGRNCGEMENSGEGIGPDGSLDRSKSSKKKARLKKSCSLMQSSSLPTI